LSRRPITKTNQCPEDEQKSLENQHTISGMANVAGCPAYLAVILGTFRSGKRGGESPEQGCSGYVRTGGLDEAGTSRYTGICTSASYLCVSAPLREISSPDSLLIISAIRVQWICRFGFPFSFR